MLDTMTYAVPVASVKPAPATPPPPRPWPVLKITGQNLAKGRRSRQQRRYLAEHLAAGKVELTKPTLKQAAALARVSVAEIYRARHARKPKPTPPSLADQLRTASPAELCEAAKAIGIDVVWDTMIAPLVGEGGPSPITKDKPLIATKAAA